MSFDEKEENGELDEPVSKVEKEPARLKPMSRANIIKKLKSEQYGKFIQYLNDSGIGDIFSDMIWESVLFNFLLTDFQKLIQNQNNMMNVVNSIPTEVLASVISERHTKMEKEKTNNLEHKNEIKLN